MGDLVPAVKSRYFTYAGGDVSAGGLERSHGHRAFAGFSMGGVNTWHTFQYCLPYFRWFNPMSGGGLDGAVAKQQMTIVRFPRTMPCAFATAQAERRDGFRVENGLPTCKEGKVGR